MDVAGRVTVLCEPIARLAGVDLVDVEYKPPVLRVTVDCDGGVDLQAIRDVTRALSNALDEADPVPGRYTLEVSSPGLERTLRTPAHFARAIGSNVVVKTGEDVDGVRRFAGRLAAADTIDSGAIEIELDTPPGGSRRIPYDLIVKARTVFAWGPSPKPGSQRKKTSP